MENCEAKAPQHFIKEPIKSTYLQKGGMEKNYLFTQAKGTA
jgi:hypothetical protein